MDKILEFTLGNLLQVILSAVILYIIILFYIRVYGKRSTSELNNFDWIVTVTIGSLFASTIILKDVSIVEGAISILVLMVLQFCITRFMARSEYFGAAIKSTPKLLLFQGQFLEENMKNERIMKSEVYAAIRQNGLKPIKQIYAVVLETNAKISVISDDQSDELAYSLVDVDGLPTKLQMELKRNEEASYGYK